MQEDLSFKVNIDNIYLKEDLSFKVNIDNKNWNYLSKKLKLFIKEIV